MGSGSPLRGDVHGGFCEGPGVQFPRPTLPVVHCVTERQARYVLARLTNRLEDVGLLLHPDKTKIVYCKDDNRRGSHEHTAFTFLGFKFCRRTVRTKRGVLFTGFAPGISPQALKAISREVRRWRLHTRTRLELDDLAAWINPIVRGWVNYYGRFYRSLLIPLLKRINAYLVRWARNKYKRVASFKRVYRWWYGLVDRQPDLFAHWRVTSMFSWIR
ncbi:MAG: reverse transcriptase [Actinobacteria bacterium]|nr:reverse transcriptase [Actinomycetota bacterium]